MPPSANQQLMFGRGRGRFIKSQKARVFDAKIALYKREYREILGQVFRNLFVQVELSDKLLRVDTDFIFPYRDLFTKQDRPKILDANNRIKATLDGLVNLVTIDDKFFFQGNYRKLVCKKTVEPKVNLTITVIQRSQAYLLQDSTKVAS